MNLDKTLIPDEIDTVERLAAWCLAIMGRAYVNKKFQEVDNGPLERAVTANPFTAGDDREYYGFRGALPLNAAYSSDKTKALYMHVDEIAEVEIPAAFLKQV
jgi:hypothetical protein